MTPTNTQGSDQDAKAIVKVLKYYPGITSHMDLTVKSPLVVELAALIKSDREAQRQKDIQIVKDARYSCYKDEQCWEYLSDDRQQGIIEHEEEVLRRLSKEGKQ